ncbi:MAG: response regulator [Geminicoccaceae bacterium]
MGVRLGIVAPVHRRQLSASPLKVLLAEDNPVNQEVAVGLLEMLDCTVTVVENGKDAVKATADDRFDLVLMDCQMPVMDGIEATRQIRASALDDRKTPIVALTANDFEDTRAACIAAGMNDLLGKPFRHQDLASLLQRWRPTQGPTLPAELEPIEARPSSLDPAPLEVLRALDPTGERRIIHRTITKFIAYSDELVAGLIEAVERSDVEATSRLTHSLKSSAANLGAMDLSRQCAEIERLTMADSLPEDIDRRLTDLKMMHLRSKQDLLPLAET